MHDINRYKKNLIARFKTLGRKEHTKEDSLFLGRFNKFNYRISQYNENNNTNYKQFEIEEFIDSGLYERFINNKVDGKSFLLRHSKLGYSLDNIFVGNRDSLIQTLMKNEDKFCPGCCKIVPKTNFKSDTQTSDGLKTSCIDCVNSRLRETDKLIRRMYNRQRHSTRERGHPPIVYNLGGRDN